MLDAFHRTGLASHMLFDNKYVDSSFCRTSMIFQADPSSSNTLHKCDSYSLHFLQFDSWIVSYTLYDYTVRVCVCVCVCVICTFIYSVHTFLYSVFIYLFLMQ